MDYWEQQAADQVLFWTVTVHDLVWLVWQKKLMGFVFAVGAIASFVKCRVGKRLKAEAGLCKRLVSSDYGIGCIILNGC